MKNCDVISSLTRFDRFVKELHSYNELRSCEASSEVQTFHVLCFPTVEKRKTPRVGVLHSVTRIDANHIDSELSMCGS